MFSRLNRTKEKLLGGGYVLGVFVGIPSPRVVELCGVSGFDYVIIDCEHGPIDPATCEEMVRAAEVTGMTPIVRVPGHDPKVILRYLDVGAQGIMAPNVNSVREAKAVVDAVKYAPIGRRGLGPGRSAAYGLIRPLREYAPDENAQTLVIAQLENISAMEEIEDVVRTPGIDAFEIGTADLSASMGYPGESSRPEVQEVVAKFVTAVLGAGSVIGDTAGDEASIKTLVAQGYRMLDCSFESVSTHSLGALVASVRGIVGAV